MLPLSPKTQSHAAANQRASINEGLMQANQGGGSGSKGGSITSNQMFTRFSNIQLQNSIKNNGGQKGSGQGNKAFQSVNNFFNPRTAGAQKHPARERIGAHHFNNDSSGERNSTFSPRSKIGQPPASSGV